MEKTKIKQYKPSSGDARFYYRETSAVNGIAKSDSSAVMGNLADVLKKGPVRFPNILAPDAFRRIPLGRMLTVDTVESDLD